MPKNVYNQFSKDLMMLYCRVKHPSIEDVLIRFAQANDDFFKWFRSNEKLIKSKIKNGRVFDAIMALVEMRSDMPMGQKLDRGNLVKYFLSSPRRQASLSPVWPFNLILKEFPDHNILSPFSDLIEGITSTLLKQVTKEDDDKKDKEQKESVSQDLVTINGLYSDRVIPGQQNRFVQRPGSLKHRNTREYQYPMFKKLFDQFTQKMADAAHAVNNPALESKIRSNGIMDMKGLYQANNGRVGQPQPAMYSISNKLINEIMNSFSDITKIQNIGRNFEVIKENLMKPFGVLGADTVQQIKQVERQRYEEVKKRIQNPSSLDPSIHPLFSPKSIEERIPYTTSDQQWVHPYVLTAMNVFFTLYSKAIQSLPVK